MLSSNIAYRNAILHILALLHKISPTLDIWPEKVHWFMLVLNIA
jgi:hypothetical protein